MSAEWKNKRFDMRVKVLLLGGKSMASVAEHLHCSRHRVSDAVGRLVFFGEIREIPGTRSPKAYEDAVVSVPSPRRGDDPSKKDIYMGGIEKDISGAESPSKMTEVRAHISGSYKIVIRRTGEAPAAIRDEQGFTIGYWSTERTYLKSASYCNGAIRVHGEDVTFRAYSNAKMEPTVLTVYPRPRQVYYKTCETDAPKEMLLQVDLVKTVLEHDGWRFDGAPILKGVIHYGGLNPQLLRYIRKGTDYDDSPIHADNSNGEPEVEIYADHEGAQDDVDLIVELPERMRALTAAATSMEETVRQTLNALSSVSEATSKIIEVQAQQAQILNNMTGQYCPKPPEDYGGAYR